MAATTPLQPLTFYDILSAPPHRTFAPNPWKTHYALALKRLPYETHPVDLPDIPSLRTSLNVPANRTLPSGAPYPTLPILHDPSTNTTLGDTFEIALYLHRTYPNQGGCLFRPGTVGLTAAFNARVDEIFTKHVALCDQMPFPPDSKDRIMQIFAERFGLSPEAAASKMSPSARESLLVEFEHALGELAKAYAHAGGTTDTVWLAGGTAEAQKQNAGREGGDVLGPWLDGEEPAYADLVVGAWLAMMEGCMPAGEWERVRGWQGGIWGRVHDGLGFLRG